MSQFNAPFEIHVHGDVPLREDVVYAQIQEALKPLWAYAGAKSLADGAASAAAKPSRAQYELLGVSGLTAPVVALDVGTLALRVVQPSGAGSAFLSNVGALNVATVLGVAGAQVGGDWVLTSGTSATSLNVQANVITGGALRLDSRGSMSVLADVQAQGSLTMLAASSLSTAVGADVLSLTGDITLGATIAMDLRVWMFVRVSMRKLLRR